MLFPADSVRPEKWQPLLRTRCYGQNMVFYRTETGSTNADAMNAGKEGAPDGAVFLAESQNAGRGRRDHIWISEPGAGLWLSVVVRPSLPAVAASFLPFCSALAVRDAVYACTGEKVELKWPNDVLHKGKKFCGILCSCRVMDGKLEFAVIGTGINVFPEAIPSALLDQATCISDFDPSVKRNQLLAAYLLALEKYVRTLENEGFISIRESFAADCITLGARVRVTGGSELTGNAEDIDESGALVVRTDEGMLHTVLAGDVSVRGVMGFETGI